MRPLITLHPCPRGLAWSARSRVSRGWLALAAMAVGMFATFAGAAMPQNPLPAMVELHQPFRGRPWSVTQAEDGSIVVGGIGSVAIFNGMRWRQITVPRIEAARTTAVKNGRLWIGTRGQVGWIDLNSDDGVFHAVLTDIPGEVFYVVPSGNDILAVSFDVVALIGPDGVLRAQQKLPVALRRFLYRWEDGWLLSGATDAFFIRTGAGLSLTDETPVSSTILTRDRIIATVPIGGKMHLFGAKGSYTYEAGTLQRIESPEWQDLTGEHLIAIFRPPGEDAPILRLGVDGGLKAFDPRTLRQLWQLRSGDDLPGAPICAPVITPAGVFFGADTAVCWIPDISGIRRLTHSRQRVNSLQPSKDGLWVCTTEGSWRIPAGSWKATDAAPGATWSVCESPLGTVRGLFRMLDLNGRRVPVDVGGAQIANVVPTGDGFVTNEIVRLSRWNRTLRMTEGVDVLAGGTSVAVDDEETVYAGTMRSGLLRWPRGKPLQVLRRRGEAVPHVQMHRGELVVLWSDGWLEVGNDHLQLPAAEERDWSSLACAGDAIVVGGGFDHGAALLLLEKRGGRWSFRPLEHPLLGTIGHADSLTLSGERLAVAGFGGSLEFSRSAFPATIPPVIPRLQEVGAASGEDGAPRLRKVQPHADELRLKPDENELRFVVAGGAEYWRQRVRFFYRLMPESVEWTATDPAGLTVLQRIGTGTHTLEVEARSPSATVTATFTVHRPPHWYASRWAFVAYLLASAAAAAGAMIGRTRHLAARARELERRVAQRTAELHQANEAKSEFLASMSHEIRNPLNGVIGLSTMLHNSARDERARRLTDALRGCADQLRLVLDDILDFSLIERGEIQLQLSTFDPVAAVHFAVIAVDPQLERTRIKVADEVAGICVRGDEGKLRQIVTNLISNAHKFGVPPEAEVELRWEQDRMIVAVSNTGPDIPPADHERIFVSFERGRPSHHRYVRGAGLGLTISSRFARAMGGEVTMRSQDGLTCFTFSAPFERVPRPPPAEVPPPRPRGGTVLAVEDETYNRLVLGHVLTGLGYEVDWARTGQEALDLLRSHGRYDAILTDWMLPDMQGGDLVRRIHNIGGANTPAVIAVTAYATAEKRREAQAAGVSGFVTKPITTEKIALALRTIGSRNADSDDEPAAEPLQLGVLLDADDATERLIDFRRQILARMDEITAALSTSDADRAGRAAHRLASQLLVIHHYTLADELRALEGLIARGEWNAAAELHRKTQPVAAALCEQLAELAEERTRA